MQKETHMSISKNMLENITKAVIEGIFKELSVVLLTAVSSGIDNVLQDAAKKVMLNPKTVIDRMLDNIEDKAKNDKLWKAKHNDLIRIYNDIEPLVSDLKDTKPNNSLILLKGSRGNAAPRR